MNLAPFFRPLGRMTAFAVILGGLCLTEVRADQILNTFGDTPMTPPFNVAQSVGEFIAIGSSDISLTSFSISQSTNGNTNESFAIFAANAQPGDSPLFTDFSQSFSSLTGTNVVTETAKSPFILQADTSYAFVMLGNGSDISVDYTTVATAGQLNAAYASITGEEFSLDGTNYLTATNSQGVVLLRLNGSLVAVPEPSSLSLVTLAGLCGSVIAYRSRKSARV